MRAEIEVSLKKSEGLWIWTRSVPFQDEVGGIPNNTHVIGCKYQ